MGHAVLELWNREKWKPPGMKHRGDIVEKRIRESNKTIQEIADYLHKSRMTLYRDFNRAELNWDDITAIYKYLDRDLAEDFPEAPGSKMGNEQVNNYCSEIEEYKDELIRLNRKYTKLLEEYYRLMNKHGNGNS